MRMTDKANEALEDLSAMFAEGNIPEAIALTMKWDVPSAVWSVSNRLIMHFYKTADAQGFRQWEKAGRKVNKGSKAFYILGPLVKKVPVKDAQPGDEDRFVQRLVGFKAIPVFRVEDTEGEPLEYQEIDPPPLMEVAEAWGLDVSNVGALPGAWADFSPLTGEIRLATPEESVFYHELAHAADQRVRGKRLKGGQHADQEVVAEMVAAVLARLYGTRTEFEGRSYKYIERHAMKAGEQVKDILFTLLGRIDRVLKEIVGAAEAAREEVAA